MAISTYKVFLMKKESAGDTYSKLVDIKEFPADSFFIRKTL